MIKYLMTGLMVTILTQPVIAETCYDPQKHSHYDYDVGSYVYSDFNEWDLVVNGVVVKDKWLYFDLLKFRKAEYSPSRGLLCSYDGDNYLISLSYKPLARDKIIVLIKHDRYDDSDFINYPSWKKSSDIYKCDSSDIQQCAFGHSSNRPNLIVISSRAFKK